MWNRWEDERKKGDTEMGVFVLERSWSVWVIVHDFQSGQRVRKWSRHRCPSDVPFATFRLGLSSCTTGSFGIRFPPASPALGGVVTSPENHSRAGNSHGNSPYWQKYPIISVNSLDDKFSVRFKAPPWETKGSFVLRLQRNGTRIVNLFHSTLLHHFSLWWQLFTPETVKGTTSSNHTCWVTGTSFFAAGAETPLTTLTSHSPSHLYYLSTFWLVENSLSMCNGTRL